GFKYSEAISPLDPRKIKASSVGEDELNLLREWDSVGDSVWASVRDSVGDSVWASVRASVRDSVGDSVGDSVRASVWASVRDSVWASVRDSVWASVGDSVWASFYAYYGTLFPQIKAWKYTEKLQAVKGAYPFNSAVELLRKGLVPASDGKQWYLLHFPDGKKAEIAWSGKL
ncbi:MAG: hypothetical protein ACYCQJ_16175, partial [Nitrososphaerales archaeon]